jgi:hypothetical protein
MARGKEHTLVTAVLANDGGGRTPIEVSLLLLLLLQQQV